MPDLVPIRRALISVSDKTDLVPFAKGLASFGVELISTGGTASALREAGLRVIGVEEVTGLPEMMDGRVKTLHPAIHGGLLARRDLPGHLEAMRQHGITPIDLVCVNLYPFEQTIRLDGVSPEEAIENIDIGGPAILRSSAKNHEFVTAVTSADQYDRVINEMRVHEGATSIELRRELAAAAFARTAEYDTTISAWMGSRHAASFPEMLRLTFAKASDLRYGENPHQQAAVYADPACDEPNVVAARTLHGKPLSYNNLLDAAAALELVEDLQDLFAEETAAVVVKHTNPCGAAIAASASTAFERAYSADPRAAYGGVLAMGRSIDLPLARTIAEGGRFLEVIVATDFSREAVSVLSQRWPDARMLATGSGPAPATRSLSFRSIVGGLLVQDRDRKPANTDTWQRAAGPDPSESTIRDAAFTATVVKHLKSNAVAIGADRRLLGGGPGQVDRVGACRLAIERAGSRIQEMSRAGHAVVAASDAFFPFPDGPLLLIEAGIACIVQPGGSKRDEETLALCEERGVSCLLTGVRHFRH